MTDRERATDEATGRAPEASAELAPDADDVEVQASAEPVEEAGSDADLDAVRRDLEETRATASQYLDDLQRLKAEFENYRKRMLREQTAMVDRAAAGVIERLLPVLDNFELALLAADRTKDLDALVRGVEMVYGELIEVLRKEGLERIEALERPFDPQLHEAVMHGDDEEGAEELLVTDEMRPGYRLGDRVVRPAMVKVARRRKAQG